MTGIYFFTGIPSLNYNRTYWMQKNDLCIRAVVEFLCIVSCFNEAFQLECMVKDSTKSAVRVVSLMFCLNSFFTDFG